MIEQRILKRCSVPIQDLTNHVESKLIWVNDCGLARERKRRGALKDVDGCLDFVVGGRKERDGVPLASDVAPGTKVPRWVKGRKLVGAVVGNTPITHVVRPAIIVNVDCLSCFVHQAAAHKSVAKNCGGTFNCLLALGQGFAGLCKTGLSSSTGLERFAGSLPLENACMEGRWSSGSLGKALTVGWVGDWGWDWHKGNGQRDRVFARVGGVVILVRGDQNRVTGLICKDKTKCVSKNAKRQVAMKNPSQV